MKKLILPYVNNGPVAVNNSLCFQPESDQHLCLLLSHYRKAPKFWDARNLCCNLPKIQIKRPNRKGYFVKIVQMEQQTVKTLIRLLIGAV